jgi:Family of unknown function (DUF6115)
VQLGPTEPNNVPSNTATDDSLLTSGQESSSLDQEEFSQETIPQDSTTSNQLSSGNGLTEQVQEPVAIERLIERLRTSENLPTILLVGGVVLMLVLMMRMLIRNTKSNRRRTHNLPDPSERIQNIHDSAQASMLPSQKAMVDAEEMARRLGAVLDNKAARLELLIEEADIKLDALNRMHAQSSSSLNPSTSQTGNQSTNQPINQSINQSNNQVRTIDPSLLDRARVEQDIEDRQSRVVGRIDPESMTQPDQMQPDQIQTHPPIHAPAPKPVPIRDQVLELSSQGLSNIDIAHQLQQPIGQVELILNLNRQQNQA